MILHFNCIIIRVGADKTIQIIYLSRLLIYRGYSIIQAINLSRLHIPGMDNIL